MVPVYIDENLRGLCRWLRFAGVDAALAAGEEDRELLAKARAQGRVLVTRDRELARQGALLLGEARTRDQLRALLGRHGWPPESAWLSRCAVCNVPLSEALPGARWRCDSCGREYWLGSHTERIFSYLRAARDAS